MAGGSINLAVKTTNDNSGLKAASADLDSFGQSAAAAGGNIEQFDKKQAAAAKALEKNFVKASALATVGIAALGGLAIKTAADFERSMDQVGAVAGATASEIGQLSTAAKQIGADTTFSASQAAGAMQELAAGGRSVAQILGGEARAAVDLAAAGNYDLAQSGRTIATVMDIWKNSQIDTNDVVNRLAGAANASRFGVEDMSAAVAQAGGVAASMGVEFDDFTAAIAATASSFASGSDAGTSFKTFLLNLDGSTDKAKQKIEELGLEFRDSNGELKSMAEIADELSIKVGTLGEAEQTAALKVIFGNDAYRTAVGLMDQTAEGVQKVNDILGNTDAGAIAEQRMSNLAGSFEEFKGSAETLAISLGEKALPAMTNMADAGTAALNAFGGLPESTQGLALGFTAISIAAPAAVALIGKMAESAKALKTVMTGGGTTWGTLGPAVSAAAIGVGALAISVDALLQKTKGYGLGELVFGNPRAASAGNQFNKDLEHTLEIARGAGVEIDGIAAAMDKYTTAIGENADKSQSAADKRQGITEALAGSLMAEEASVWELKAAYDEIGRTYEANGLKAEAAQATFDNETKVLEKYALAVDDMNIKMAGAFNAIEDANAGVVLSTQDVAAAIPPATTALDDFTTGLEEGANWSDELGQRLDELAGRFSVLDPQMAINNINLAILKEELADAERNGTGFSEVLGMTTEQMKDGIKVLEDDNAARSENADTYRELSGEIEHLSRMGLLASGSFINIDAAIKAANLSSEEQITLAGQVGQAFGVLAVGDIPSFISALQTIGETSPEVMKTVVDSITDPEKKAAILDHLRGMGSEADTILTVGFGEASNSAVNALNEGLAAGVPMIEGTGGQLGFAAAEGLESQNGVMYSSGFTLGKQGGQGIVDGFAAMQWAVNGAAAGLAAGGVAAAAGPQGQDSKSPSRKWKKLGEWAGEGYVLGMEESEARVMRAGEAMATAGLDGAKGASDGYGVLVSAFDRHGRSPFAENGNPMGWVMGSNGAWKWVEIDPDAKPDPEKPIVYGGADPSAPPPIEVDHPLPPPPKPRETTTPKGPGNHPKTPGPGGAMQPGDGTRTADGRVYWDGTGEEPSEPWVGFGALLGQAGAGKAAEYPLVQVGPNVWWDPNKNEYVTGGLQPLEPDSNVGWDPLGGDFGVIDPVAANYGYSVYQDSAGVWRDVVTNEEAIDPVTRRFKTAKYQQDALDWLGRLQNDEKKFGTRGLQAPVAQQSTMAKFWAKGGMAPRSMSNDPFRMNSFDFFTERGDWAALGYGEGSEWSSDPWYGDVPKEWLKTAAGQEYLALRGIDPMNNPATRADYNRWHPNAMGGGGTRVRKGSGFETVYRRESADNTPKQIVINVQAWDTQDFIRNGSKIREAIAYDERAGY